MVSVPLPAAILPILLVSQISIFHRGVAIRARLSTLLKKSKVLSTVAATSLSTGMATEPVSQAAFFDGRRKLGRGDWGCRLLATTEDSLAVLELAPHPKYIRVG